MRASLLDRLGSWRGAAFAILAVGLFSAAAALLGRLQLFAAPVLLLLAVLVTAVRHGSAAAVLAAVVAFGALTFLFVDPRYTFTVADPEEWIVLGVFLATALIAGQLAADAVRRAREADERRRETQTLYDLVQLISRPDLPSSLPLIAERLCSELGASAVRIDLPGAARQDAEAATAGDAEARIFLARVDPVRQVSEVLTQGTGDAPDRAHRWTRIRPPTPPETTSRLSLRRAHIRGATGEVGRLLIAVRPDSPPYTPAQDRLLEAVTAQLALAVERANVRKAELEAEVLRRTDLLRTSLLDAVSHELRTPLASVIAAAGSLRDADVSWTDAEREAFAIAIESEARRLDRIVGNLLDMNRLQSGSLVPARELYDPSQVLREAVGRLAAAVGRERLQLDVPPELPAILLDPVEVEQVIANLVENAARYSPSAGPIEITARPEPDGVRIEVADRGPGISQAAMPRIFEPFFRGPGGKAGTGLGLGLALARGLVEAHGGRLWAENRPGGGARFVFTLPGADRDPTPGTASRVNPARSEG